VLSLELLDLHGIVYGDVDLRRAFNARAWHTPS
jgi:hypothetical protein